MRTDRFPLRRGRQAAALALLGALALVAPGPRPAQAQAPADIAAARQLFREGSQLSQEGKWEQARQRFLQSLQLRRAAITLYSLGVTQKETGQFVEALESLRAFLQWPPNEATEPYLPIARELVGKLEKRVARVTLGLVPEGIKLDRLEIDGVKLGGVALDVPRLVNPGHHEVLAVAVDRREGRVEFTLAEGAETRVRIELGRRLALPAASASGAPTPSSAPPPMPAPSAMSPSPPASAPPPEEPRSRALPVALMASGGAVAVVGVAVGLWGLSQARNAPSKQSPEVDAAKTKALVGDVLGGLGLLTAGLGGYLWFRADRSPTESGVSSLTPWVSFGTAGVAGRFLGGIVYPTRPRDHLDEDGTRDARGGSPERER
jgi:hypothetical protein